MTDTIRYAWAPITKTEKQVDGSLIVHGPAANPHPDRDGQKLSPEWLAEAFPQWVSESGNIREQHDAKRAVGRVVGYTQDGDSHFIAARVVDPIAIAKVEAGVLQGFSVGVKAPIIAFGDPQAPMGTVVGGSICETSLVDRMSNPTTLFEIAKADDAGDLTAVEDAHVVQHATLTYGEADIATARAVVAAVDDLLAKADTSPDDEVSQITTAQQAITLVAKLIRGEADGLANGNLNECWDISNLLDAVRALRYFIDSETYEAAEAVEAAVSKTDTPTPPAAATATSSTVDTGTEATVTKNDTAEGAVVTEATGTVTLDELVKSDGFTSAITQAVTAATKPLLDRLDKVEAAPVPGGPVIARTAGDTAAARAHDAATLNTEADALLVKADSTSDPVLAQGYRERAKDLRVKASV